MRRVIEIRRGRSDDSRPAFDVSMAAMSDLFARQGIDWTLDPESFWTVMEPITTYLASHAAEWWVAEDPSDGSLVGYARSVERGHLFELSELFVRPDRQSAGLGARLLDRAFPAGRGEVRVIVATSDVRGLARYYRAGTVARFPIASLTAPPKPARPTELEFVSAKLDDVAEVAPIEQAVLGHPRHRSTPGSSSTTRRSCTDATGGRWGLPSSATPARARSPPSNRPTRSQSCFTSKDALMTEA
jgi:GNAT superfamily N-acetyltransferase